MPSMPLGLSAYKRADLPPVTLKNMFYEKNPANLEDQVVIMTRPRIKQFAAVGPGPIRGVFHKAGAILGRILTLSAGNLYRVDPPPAGVGTATLIGAPNGTGRMSAAGNASVVVLACGASAYSTDGVSLSTIAMPDGQNVLAVANLNSRFLLVVESLGRFYWTAPGGITVDPLDYATAESQPDGLMTLMVINGEAWMVGRDSLEVWISSGDLDLPFRRMEGRSFGIGCAARDTVQKLIVNGSESMCWVGADGKVYRTAPNPVPISDHGMEERIKKADASTLYATRYSWIGHDFYVLHIPGQGSFACDLSTGMWDELTSFGKALFRGAVSAVGPADQPLLGDDTLGVLWELSDAVRTDAGSPIVSEFTGLLENNGPPIRLNNLLLDVSTGLAADPMADPVILLSMSDDYGAEFGEWLAEPLGRQGERGLQVIWEQLGLVERPGCVMRWQTAEPITVRKAKYNESYR